MRRFSSFFLLFTSVALCSVQAAQAADGVVPAAQGSGGVSSGGVSAPVPPRRLPFPVDAHIDAYAKLGSDRRLTGVEAFAPLSWDGQILTFADLRFVGDDADGREFNAGLGARRVSDDGSYILGGYGFFDRRRSSTGNLYSQMTLGSEILTEDWDFRLNTYLPLSKERILSETRMALPASLTLSGTGILASGGNAVSVATERPLAGADIEVGRKLPFLENSWFADTRAYAGAFHFDAEGVRAMDGFRFRVETAPLSWLRFGAEHQQDNIRGETDFIEARVRIPLDFWRRGKGREATRPEGILNRLDTRISRDVDVVTQEGAQARTERIDDVPVLNAATGTAQKVYVVDNAAAGGGDGSAETPFNTLAAAQGAADAHDIIYVRHGEGTTAGMNVGVTLGQTGQRLIGSGVALDFDAGTMTVSGIPGGIGDGAVIEAATAAPVLTNAGGNGISITADDVEVAGLTVNGAGDNGIYAYNADGVTIRDVTASGSANDGVRIEADGAAVDLTGVVIEGVSASGNLNGIRLYAQNDASLAAKVESSAATGNTQHGVVVYDDSTAGSVDADLGGGSQGSAGLNAITGNTLEDLALDTDGAALSAENNWWGQAGGPISTNVYGGAPLDDGLVMHWTFDDGTATDRSGNGYDGTLLNSPTPTSGALDFNNPADSESVQGVDVNESDNGNALSVFLKIKPDILINAQTPISKWEYVNGGNQNSWAIKALNADGTNFFVLIATGADAGNNYFTTSDANLMAGSWAQIGFVYDGGGAGNAARLKVYNNAVQLNGAFSGAIPTTLYDSNVPVRVAFPIINNPAFGQYFDGLVDDVRIYNRALSVSEVSELYRMNATGTVTTTGALSSAPP